MGLGNDVVVGVEQATLVSGSGNDLLDASAFGGPVTMNGDAGNDTLLGTAFNDFLVGWKGLDSIVGGDGNDTQQGGADADSLVGGLGIDSVDGQDGTDKVSGGAGGGAVAQATDTVVGTAAEISNALSIVGTWIDSV